MSASSKKRFIITQIPKDTELDEFAKANHHNTIDLVFNGGEEYEIVATVPPKNIEKIKKIAKVKKINLIQIGHVENGNGVFFQHGKKQTRIKDKGWTHFS